MGAAVTGAIWLRRRRKEAEWARAQRIEGHRISVERDWGQVFASHPREPRRHRCVLVWMASVEALLRRDRGMGDSVVPPKEHRQGRGHLMRFVVARPHDRYVPGYAPRGTKAHAVEVSPAGRLLERTMCGVDVAGWRIVRAGSARYYDWLDEPHGRCRRCEQAIERRVVAGDEVEAL